MAVRVSVSEMARDGVKDKQGKKRGKVQTPEPPFWKLQRQTYAMEKSLANGGLATIASMIKKMLGRRRRAHGTNLGARALKCPTAFWEHPFALVAKEIRMVRHSINLHTLANIEYSKQKHLA